MGNTLFRLKEGLCVVLVGTSSGAQFKKAAFEGKAPEDSFFGRQLKRRLTIFFAKGQLGLGKGRKGWSGQMRYLLFSRPQLSIRKLDSCIFTLRPIRKTFLIWFLNF